MTKGRQNIIDIRLRHGRRQFGRSDNITLIYTLYGLSSICKGHGGYWFGSGGLSVSSWKAWMVSSIPRHQRRVVDGVDDGRGLPLVRAGALGQVAAWFAIPVLVGPALPGTAGVGEPSVPYSGSL